MTRTHHGDHRSLAALLAVFAAFAMIAALFATAPPAAAQEAGDTDAAAAAPNDVTVERFAGGQRYETARLISEDAFDADDITLNTVVIAKAEDWPDALAGNYLAGLYNSPILLVSRDAVQADTLQELERLEADRVLILGGVNAISPANETTLEDAGYDVVRLAGTTRYETAAQIALSVEDQDGDYIVGELDGQRTAIIATGQAFADALVSGAAAWSESFPLLLTPGATLHPAAEASLEELDIEHVIIPGGTGAVSAGVQDAIEDLGIDTTRVFGPGRWETAAAFATFVYDDLGYSAEEIDIATGFDFPDALTMGPHAGALRAPLLLTNGTDDTPVAAVTDWLRTTACESEHLNIAGGVGAVNATNAAALVAAANDCPVGPDVFDVDLSWENEVNPDAEGPVDATDATQFGWGQPDAEGQAVLTFADEGDGLTFDLTVTGLESEPQPIAGSPAHIHAGELNENGPVVVVLGSIEDYTYDAATQTLTGSGAGVVGDDDDDIFAALLENPSDYYVNVHSAEFPAGAVRGQLPDGGQDDLPAGIVPQPAEDDGPEVTVSATGGVNQMTVTGTATAVGDATLTQVVYNLQNEAGDPVGEPNVPVTYANDGSFDFTVPGLDAGTYTIFVTASDDTGAFTVASASATVTADGDPGPADVDADASGVVPDAEPNTTVTVTVVDIEEAPVTGLDASDISYTLGDNTGTLAGNFWLDFSEDSPGVYTATVNPAVVPAGPHTLTNWTVSGVVIEASVDILSTVPDAPRIQQWAGYVAAVDGEDIDITLTANVVDLDTGEVVHPIGDTVTIPDTTTTQYFVVEIDPDTGDTTNRGVNRQVFYDEELQVGYALGVFINLETNHATYYLAEEFTANADDGLAFGLTEDELNAAFTSEG